MTEKRSKSAEFLLGQLGELSSRLTGAALEEQAFFEKPLRIIHEALGFHVSVLYKVSNVIDDELILEVAGVFNPRHVRPDLRPGAKICLRFDDARTEFVNEVAAFRNRNVSAINVPGWGCDIVGAVPMPEDFGHGYLLGGDYFGDESGTQEYEIRTFEIMCNLLSAILMKAQFEKLAIYDGLTGLPNSRAIRAELESAFQRQRRQNNGMGAIALADIDHFKKINDQYGHIQGDVVLQEVGRIIGAAIRKHIDVGGRYGGEEFLLIYADSEPDQVMRIVERLRQTIAAHDFPRIGADGTPLPDETLRVTMSFGIARLGDLSVEQSKEVLAKADRALYRSKEGGRNRVTVSEP